MRFSHQADRYVHGHLPDLRGFGKFMGTHYSKRHPAAEKSRPTVLVVDDEDNFLTLLQWFLRQRGYEVVTASSVEQAMDRLERNEIDVALIDIKLGAGDGLMLLGEVVRRSPELNVLIMTAYPTAGSAQQAYDRGAARYLTKPVDLQELAKTLDSLF